MGKYMIPVVKAKRQIEVDTDLVVGPTDENPDAPEFYAYLVQLGLKAVLNRNSKINKSNYSSEEAYQTAAYEQAEKLLKGLYEGDKSVVKMTGVKQVKKASGSAIRTEARRIAREDVRQWLKDNGEKISKYSAADITAAADTLIESDPTYMEEAKANIEKRTAKAKAVAEGLDLSAMQAKAKPDKPKAAPKTPPGALAGLAARRAPQPQATKH